jgi:short-subunit dehydrogenase
MRGGQAAIVTGASRGIGQAVATVLGAEGFALTLVARREGPLRAAAEALAATGVATTVVATDVVDRDAAARIVAAHRGAYGRLDVVVAAAGAGRPAAVADTDDELLSRMLAVHVEAPLRLLRAALPDLQAAGAEHGRALAVLIASLAGVAAVPGFAAYSAAKAAAVSLAASVSAEEGARGVRATAICPGYVATALTAGLTDVAAAAMLRPEDVAEAVRFLVRLSSVAAVPTLLLERVGTPGFAP